METPPIDPRDAEVIAHIDETLQEYDHQRVMEERNLADLQVMVNGGLITQEQAEARHYAWLHRRELE